MLYVFKKVFSLIKPYKKEQALGLFMTILVSLAGFAMPLISRWMIDDVATPSINIQSQTAVDEEGNIVIFLDGRVIRPGDVVQAYQDEEGRIVVPLKQEDNQEIPVHIDDNGNIVLTGQESAVQNGGVSARLDANGDIVIATGRNDAKVEDVSAYADSEGNLVVAWEMEHINSADIAAYEDINGNVVVAVSDIPAFDMLFYGILFFAVVSLTQPIIGVLRDILFLRISEKVTRGMRNTMFSKMLFSNFHFLNKLRGGDLISIITNDGRTASDFISVIFIEIFANVVMLILILTGLFMQEVWLTLIVLGLFSLYFVFNVFYTRRLQKMSLTVQENYDEICTCIDQSNKAILSTKAYNQEKSAEDKFHQITDKMYRDNIRIGSFETVLGYVTQTVSFICLIVLYCGGIMRVLQGEMTLGGVFALGQYFMMLDGPLSELTGITMSSNVIAPIFERIEGYTNLKQEDVGTYEGVLTFPDISIRNLSFAYTDEEQVDAENEEHNDHAGARESRIYALHNVTLQLPPHGLVNIVGESGSGKTTFTKLMMGLYPVPPGKIFFGNRDINDISIATLRGNIGYVPQESEILNDTIFNNIRFGDKDIWLDEAMEVCTMLRLHSKIMSLPDEYNSVITERVNLSGGEKQRILIARAILRESPIIIMDEPLSALDEENSDLVSRIIMRLAEEKLILMITHYECETLKPVMRVTFSRGAATVFPVWEGLGKVKHNLRNSRGFRGDNPFR